MVDLRPWGATITGVDGAARERAETIVPNPASRPASQAARASLTVPAWLTLTRTALTVPSRAAAARHEPPPPPDVLPHPPVPSRPHPPDQVPRPHSL